MKKLIIVRHAKSSWDLPVEDHNRSLMQKGIVRAQDHAKLLKKNLDFTPEYWVSSFATRALHTAVIFADAFERVKGLKIKKELYTFNANSLLEQINALPDDKDSVILFSHNDACLNVVNHLTGAGIEEFKTASVAVIHLENQKWNEISQGSLQLLISKGNIIHGN